MLRLPVGPRGSWIPTFRFIGQPRRMLEQWRQQYGDPFLLHALNGPIVMTGREDLIREIYGADPDGYAQFAEQTILPVLGAGSIFSMAGAAHRRERKLLMPMFHGDRMRAYGQSMCETAEQQALAAVQQGRCAILPLMTEISFGVIVQNIIGGTSRQQLSHLVQASRSMIDSISPVILFTRKSHFRFLGLSPWDRFLSARQRLNELMDQIIESRSQSNEQHDDILSLLCQSTYEDGQPMSRDHVRDELVSFLFAGHETTALSMTWAMYHLHRDSSVLQRLLNELDSAGREPAQLASCPYLRAVIQETLRIHPIVTETVRKLAIPMRLGEYELPTGMAVSAATVLAHYNPDVFPEPDRFRPERFLDKNFSPFQYMPFGGGHRRCIGAAFASYEMAMVLGTLLKLCSFELTDPRVVVPKRRSVTMGPSNDVPMVIRRR